MATAQADSVKAKCLVNLAAARMKLGAWSQVPCRPHTACAFPLSGAAHAERVAGVRGVQQGPQARRTMPQGVPSVSCVSSCPSVCFPPVWCESRAPGPTTTADLRCRRVCLDLWRSRGRAHIQLGNFAPARDDVTAALALEPNSPDALTLKLSLDKVSLANAKQGAAAQKKAFGSFWGKTQSSSHGDAGSDARSTALNQPLYQDKLAQSEAAAARVVCWMRMRVDEEDMDGRVVVELQPKWAPRAVENFRCLCTGERSVKQVKNDGQDHPLRHATDTYLDGCALSSADTISAEDQHTSRGPECNLSYVGSIIHRACKGFVLQGGDIVFKQGERVGEGVASIYGGGFASERPASGRAPKHLCPGLLAMANSGRASSNGCQFYVTMDAAPWLDDDFVVIGQVKEGMHMLRRVEALPVDEEDRPLARVEIVACGQLTPAEVCLWEEAMAGKRKAAEGELHIAPAPWVGRTWAVADRFNCDN